MRPFDNCISPMERDLRQRQMYLNEMRELDDFKKCITSICKNYIKMIDTKISVQDLHIKQAEDYMRDKILESTTEIIMKLLQDEKITIGFTYDPETESLNFGGVVVV